MKWYKNYTQNTKKPDKLFYFLFFLPLLFGCNSDPLQVDVSNIEVNLEVKRMEEDLFDQKLPAAEKHLLLQKKYTLLYEVFFESMLREGMVQDPMAATYLQKFSSNADMLSIYQEIHEKFSDFEPYHKELNEAFRHYKYYFPDSALPEIVTFYSNFNANIFPVNTTLGIGLDMYLGPESEIVKNIPIESLPQFIKDKMDPKYLVTDAMKFWLFNRFFDDQNDDFLSTIISSGKIMYLMDAMFPETEDYLKMGYSESEEKWCRENEVNIWTTIVDNEILYSKDQKVIMQYITDGPFTKGLPEDSPARVGFWMGWQMVRDYMAKSKVSVLDLLSEKNYRKILKEYDPNE